MRLFGQRSGLLLFIFTAVFIIVSSGHLPADKLIWHELQDTGHTLIFGLLAFVALGLVHHSRGSDSVTPSYTYLFVGAACLATGFATEVMQMLTGRSFSSTDILRDLAGITVAVGLYAVFDRQNGLRRVLRGSIFLLACALLAASLYPLGSLALDYHARQRAFPVILDLQAGWVDSFIRQHGTVLDKHPDAATCGPAMDHTVTGLHLSPAPRYPGLTVTEPSPDWQAYQYLTFALFSNQAEPFDLVIRIHDRQHNQALSDRFNRQLHVAYGENRYRIPLAEVRNSPVGRELDMVNIAGVMLFAVDITNPLEFCAGVIRLEK